MWNLIFKRWCNGLGPEQAGNQVKVVNQVFLPFVSYIAHPSSRPAQGSLSMSDLDNELLALAGGDICNAPNSTTAQAGLQQRSKKSAPSSAKSKRRRTMEMDTESDMEMGSDCEDTLPKEEISNEEDGPSRITPSTLYPFEGIYKDHADKQKIQSMTELDREAILGDRQDEIQQIKDRENIKSMVRARDEASGKRYSAREKSRLGATSEKIQKLDELKQRRQAKERRPKLNEGHSTEATRKPNDWDDGSEDGEIDAFEEQALARAERAAKKLDDMANLEDIRSVMLTRARAAELCSTKFFEEYVKGMWVRVSVGFSKDDPKREVKYRVGEIRNVVQHRKYYQVEGQATKVALLVVLAKDEKTVLLDVVSNSSIQENEWMFVVGECQRHKVRMPSKKEISRKVKLLEKYKDWVKDEVRAKKDMRAQGLGPTTLLVTERLRLESERDQAAALGNVELHAQLTRQLEQASSISFKSDSLMSELNERNRKANREEIRRAELAANDLRRQQMKALEAGAAVKLDPSARVRINPKLTYDAKPEPASRPANSQSQTNETTINATRPSAATANQSDAPRSKAQLTRFEEMVANQVHVDIDIGDF